MFREAERLDTAFTQSGTVAVPNQSGHVYLVTNWQGQHRLAVLSRPTIAREMFGILTTLQAGRGAQLTPVATPIALLLLEGALLGEAVFGRMRAGEPMYDRYRQHLARVVDDGFARFAVD